MPDLEQQFAWVAGVAPTLFLRDGCHAPMLFLQKIEHGDWGLLVLAARDAQEKAAMYSVLRQVFAPAPAFAYIFVSEAWALKCELKAIPEGPISEHPNHVEILAAYGADRTGRRRTKTWRIEREDGPRLVEAEDLSGHRVETVLDSILLHQPAPNIEMRQNIREN